MGFGGDERGVTVQIGAVLLLGIIVLSLSVYQVTVVPAENEQVEYRHSQAVQEDLVELRNGLLRAGSASTTRPVSVRLGADYPPRTVFVNPPPATGRLATDGTGTLVVANATASDDDVADYWGGSDPSFETARLVYRPDYHQYPNAPTTVTENSVAYNRFDGGTNLPLTGQTLVDGRRLFLVAVDGSLSTQGVRPTAVDLEPKSPATRSVSVSESDGDVTLVVPTDLSADAWRELFASQGEYDPDGSDPDAYVRQVTAGDTGGTVNVTLESGVTYDLRIAKVGVGTGATTPSAHYLVGRPTDPVDVPENGTRELVVEVRDRYNNPASGETVNATLDGVGSLSSRGTTADTLTGLRTDEEGRVRISYEAPDVDGRSDVRVDVSYDASPSDPGFDRRTRQDTSFDFDVYDLGGGGSGGNGGSGGDGSGGSGNSPTVDTITVSDGNCANGNGNGYCVDWSASDDDGDLTSVTVQVLDGSGAVRDEVTETFAETSSNSGDSRLGVSRQSGDQIRVVAEDAAGNTDPRTVDA